MSSDLEIPDVASRDLPKNQRIGREVSFGIQQTLACWATDFIDPYVGKWFQNKYGAQEHKVTSAHTWGGEILGDSAAFFVYMFSKRALSKPIDGITAIVKKAMDPVYNRFGKRSLEGWRKRLDLSEDDPRYKHKLDMYKEFQAENLVDSGIIATSSTLLNVGTQRVLGNKQGLGLILTSKLIGAALTVGLMLGLRTALPTATKTLDDELSDRYFSKVAAGVKKLAGVKEEKKIEKIPADAEQADATTLLADAPLVERTFSDDKRTAFVEYLHRSYRPGQTMEAFCEEQKNICDTFIKALGPKGDFTSSLSARHAASLEKLFAAKPDALITPEAIKQSSLVSLRSIVLNRRDDMASRKRLLADPAFRSELAALFRAPAPAKIFPENLTDDKRDALIETLVQTQNADGHEPAVHVYATAKGQLLEHVALMDAFAGNAAPMQSLAQALAAELPAALKSQATALAADYLEDRRHAAKLVVDALALEGPLVNEAVQKSEAMRLANGDRSIFRRKSHVDKLISEKRAIADAREKSLAYA